jgi:hypothetical protein
MVAGSYDPRTTKERHHQAFLLLIGRFTGGAPTESQKRMASR